MIDGTNGHTSASGAGGIAVQMPSRFNPPNVANNSPRLQP